MAQSLIWDDSAPESVARPPVRLPALPPARARLGLATGALVVSLEGDVRGHDGVRRWYATVLDVFPDFTIEGVTVRDLGDLTLAAVGFRGHGSGSDTPFEMTLWSAAEWREGKCVWWGNYRTEPEALEAVGLRE